MQPRVAHKHVEHVSGPLCIQITVKNGTLRTYRNGKLLNILDVAHDEIALRFAKRTQDVAYPGGDWMDVACGVHSIDSE